MSVIRDELLALKDSGGMIHAEQAVEWARKHPESALHASLTWDDAKAAHEHRVWQARRLIQLHLVLDDQTPIVVSLSIDRVKGGGYRTVSDVVQSVELSRVMLDDALAELTRVQTRYAKLKELAGVWGELEEARRRRQRRDDDAGNGNVAAAG